jgi:hypothetical protein
MNEERQRFYDNTRQFFGRTVWSHKTYEIERESWACKACAVRWASIISATATLVLASVSSLDIVANKTLPWYASPAYLTIIVGAISFLVSLYQSIVNPEKQEALVRQAAKDHLWIRDRLQLLLEATLNGEELEKLVGKRKRLLEARDMLHKWAPDTSPSAYKKATKALKINEHLTLHDNEIDSFLPASLQQKNKGDSNPAQNQMGVKS